MSAWRNIMVAIVAFPNRLKKMTQYRGINTFVVRKSALIAPISGICADLKRLLHIGWVANKWHKSMKCSEANILIKTGQSANSQQKHGKTNLHKSFNRTPPSHTHKEGQRGQCDWWMQFLQCEGWKIEEWYFLCLVIVIIIWILENCFLHVNKFSRPFIG